MSTCASSNGAGLSDFKLYDGENNLQPEFYTTLVVLRAIVW